MDELETCVFVANVMSWIVALHFGLFMFWQWITHDSLSAVAATIITMTVLWSLIIKILEAYQRKVKNGKQ